MSGNLAAQLRQGTAESHTMAENTAFMKCFLKGIVEQGPFQKLLADLYFLYSALEEEMQSYSQHAVVGPIYFPELNRQAKLEEDLKFYYGEQWRDRIRSSDAGKQYVSRIRWVAATHPALLVAHAYVRYLGDLSGGQSLKNIVRSAMELPADRGTGFYEFDAFPTPEARCAFKGKYRDALNSLALDETLAEKIVEEANFAFQLNCNVMHALESDVKAAIGEHTFELLTKQDRKGSTERQPSDRTSELAAVE
ncbi:heme oxygenase (biliverdin-producing) [Synechococcus sp. PCC 7336]|uniref:biliverdin-producing heme oxygenase n=1 Tax=Synechococcus sp. PCC 7336 TaxID=195250 RepID=UPI00037988CD|nr:heme oxygenase (biliverdin-producing) [Synechococcus sp. PCC 7336]